MITNSIKLAIAFFFFHFLRATVTSPLRLVKEEKLIQQRLRILVSHHAALKNKVFAR